MPESIQLPLEGAREGTEDDEIWLEPENAPGQRVWAYRKAAWAIEDLEQGVGLIYRQKGRKGLERIENLGPKLSRVVEEQVVSSPWTIDIPSATKEKEAVS